MVPKAFQEFVNDTVEANVEVQYATNKFNKYEILLGVITDNDLSFENQIQPICQKTNQKLNALSRTASSINFEQLKIIMHSIIFSEYPILHFLV